MEAGLADYWSSSWRLLRTPDYRAFELETGENKVVQGARNSVPVLTDLLRFCFVSIARRKEM